MVGNNRSTERLGGVCSCRGGDGIFYDELDQNCGKKYRKLVRVVDFGLNLDRFGVDLVT